MRKLAYAMVLVGGLLVAGCASDGGGDGTVKTEGTVEIKQDPSMVPPDQRRAAPGPGGAAGTGDDTSIPKGEGR